LESSFSLRSLDREKPVHLVGIGGAGMSAIATVLLEMGYGVEGSDIKESQNIRRLRQLGAVVGIGHRADNLGTASVVVRSTAISDGNAELAEARRKHIPVMGRAEMLAAIMSTREGIAVAGTHGKTTTSSLVAQMLIGCGADPSFLIGGELNEIGGNAHYGAGRYLVAEADESDGSLLFLRPVYAVLTNVDADHLDYFEDIEHTARVFLEFLGLLPPDGFAVVCGDDPRARGTGFDYRDSGGRLFLYGEGEVNDYRLSGASTGAAGISFEAFFRGEPLGRVRVGVPGIHNAYNAMAALAVGHQLGFAVERAIEGIGRFQGVRRRFETIGDCRGIRVVDDYAHHPTEARAVLDLARAVAESRVVVVFQPHRYTRTRILADEFGRSFAGADLVVVTDVYGAGEDPEPGVTGELIADSITAREKDTAVVYEPSRAGLARAVVPLLEEGDLVITMGAGDVTQCAREILELLGEGGC
jgi:UDP-N-acetylmuramate--alanine ligase